MLIKISIFYQYNKSVPRIHKGLLGHIMFALKTLAIPKIVCASLTRKTKQSDFYISWFFIITLPKRGD